MYNFKHTLQARVSIRIKFKSERSQKEREKQINQEIRKVNTVICFTEVRFQRT
jgi:DNA-directed RNA polymerase subunit L